MWVSFWRAETMCYSSPWPFTLHRASPQDTPHSTHFPRFAEPSHCVSFWASTWNALFYFILMKSLWGTDSTSEKRSSSPRVTHLVKDRAKIWIESGWLPRPGSKIPQRWRESLRSILRFLCASGDAVNSEPLGPSQDRLLPHVLCFSSSPKHLGNRIWYTFPELQPASTVGWKYGPWQLLGEKFGLIRLT